MHELEGPVTEIVSSVCTNMLGLEVTPDVPHVQAPGERHLVGCVQITGAWSGAVLISCSPDFARLAAKIIFANPGEPSLADEHDALGEISNMIAGNLKAVLPAPSFLALPTVSDSIDGVLQVLGSRPIARFELLAAQHPLAVVLVTRDAR
jgi:chemotaxis protein CheX